MYKILYGYNIKMKMVFRTVIFHLIVIIIFTFIYKHIAIDLKDADKDKVDFIDYLVLSVAVQSGTGFSQVSPKNNISKIAVIIQELILICSHIFTIYIFTI
jgi:heme A synthase